MGNISYRIKHIGINTHSTAEAAELAKTLCEVFGFEYGPECDASIFAGPLMEIMRHSNLGVNGHIALQTDDVEAAMEDLASRGITFRPEFVRRDESGKVYFAYLDQEFGGFAFHLTT